MATIHSKFTKMLLRDVDISSFVMESSPDYSVDMSDTTVYGKTNKTKATALGDSKLSFSGLYDPVADGIDALVVPYLGVNVDQLAMIGYGGFAVGQGVSLIGGKFSGWKLSDPVGDMVKFTAEIEGSDGGVVGRSLHDTATTETITANGASVDAGAGQLTTLFGGIGHLHVLSATGTSPSLTVKIQDSADNSTFADLITFTAATARTFERKFFTGTVRRYIRATWTIAGTTPVFGFAAGFGRGGREA